MSAQSGNVDTNSAHNVETLTRFQAKVAQALRFLAYFLQTTLKIQIWVYDHSAQYIKIFDLLSRIVIL